MSLVVSKRKRAFALPALAVSLVWALSSFAGPIELRHYDEVYDENGRARPQYANILRIEDTLEDADLERIKTETAKDLSGDNSISPILRVLSGPEYANVIQAGVIQRGRALLAFAQDYYSGKKSYHDNPNLPPEKELKEIMTRYGEGTLTVNPKQIVMQYGPDLIRDETGVWRPVEDSIGSLGGTADLVANQEVLIKHVPQYKEVLKKQNPEKFYDERVAYFERNKLSNGVVVAIIMPHSGDHEDSRLSKLYYDRGVITVSPKELQAIKVRDGAAYVTIAGKNGSPNTEKKIGFLSVNTEYQYLKSVPNLRELVASGRVPSDRTPDTEFLNDKQLYRYVPEMVRAYLHEEPILQNIETHLFTLPGSLKLNEKYLDSVIGDPRNSVLKEVNNRGGKGISVGAKIPRSEFSDAIEKVKADPSNVVNQDYTPLPIVGDQIADIRVHSIISANGDNIVAPIPWGRNIELNGNGKVNLSGTGAAQVVLIDNNLPAPPVPVRLQTVQESDSRRMIDDALSRHDLNFVERYLERLSSSAPLGSLEALEHLYGTGTIPSLVKNELLPALPGFSDEESKWVDNVVQDREIKTWDQALDALVKTADISGVKRLADSSLLLSTAEKRPALLDTLIKKAITLSQGNTGRKMDIGALQALAQVYRQPGFHRTPELDAQLRTIIENAGPNGTEFLIRQVLSQPAYRSDTNLAEAVAKYSIEINPTDPPGRIGVRYINAFKDILFRDPTAPTAKDDSLLKFIIDHAGPEGTKILAREVLAHPAFASREDLADALVKHAPTTSKNKDGLIDLDIMQSLAELFKMPQNGEWKTALDSAMKRAGPNGALLIAPEILGRPPANKSLDDALAVLKLIPKGESPWATYGKFLTEYYPRFMKSATDQQIREFLKLIPTLDALAPLQEKWVQSSRNASEFLFRSASVHAVPTEPYKVERTKMVDRNVNQFIALKPDLAQLKEAVAATPTSYPIGELYLNTAIPKADSPRKIIDLLSLGNDTIRQRVGAGQLARFVSLHPSSSEIIEFAKIAQTDGNDQITDALLALKPSGEEISLLMANAGTSAGKSRVAERALPKTQTGADFVLVLKNSPENSGHPEKRGALLKRHEDHFVEIHPSKEEMKEVFGFAKLPLYQKWEIEKKYKAAFPSPSRLECLMQKFSKLSDE